jgi:hypothetical protein
LQLASTLWAKIDLTEKNIVDYRLPAVLAKSSELDVQKRYERRCGYENEINLRRRSASNYPCHE